MLKYFFPDLSKRSSDLEIMDNEKCNEKKLINTVKQFAVLNFLLTSSRRLIKKYIAAEIKKDTDKEYTFLDIGSGGCDIVLWFVKYCKKKNYKIKITCLDNDKKIINYARTKCKDFKNIVIIQNSIYELENFNNFDFIFANHFLHHFDDTAIKKIMKLIIEKTNKIFLINDINRLNIAYFLYTIFTGLFFHNSFAFYDGRLSIKKGFLKKELKQLLFDLNNKLEIINLFPFRIIIKSK